MEYIELKNVSKRYDNIEAIKNINLSIKKGEIFGIIGLSGAGKSTLIRLINKLENASSGQVIVNGVDISLLKDKELLNYRQKCSMIFQNFNLLSSRTVYSNIALALEISNFPKDKIENRVNELLKVVQLENFKNSYISTLSGGQKQRVAIARAIANNPDILLSDESTSALDPITSSSILDLLREINEKLNITIVLITHQMEVVKNICDRVAVMKNGEIIEQSTVKELFINPKTEFSKKLIQEVKMEIPKNSKNIIKLIFDGKQADIPYTSLLIKKFNTDINILAGNINTLSHGAKVGYLLIEIKTDSIDDKIKWLEENKVKVEIL